MLRRPSGEIDPADFELRQVPIPAPGEGEVLVRTLLLSIDAANRAWMNAMPTYKPPVPVGGVMEGVTVGRVEASRDPRFSPGDLVEGFGGWQDYAVERAGALYPLTPREPLTQWVNALGVAGKTAYFGVREVGRPRPGDQVLVSGAAGSVGSLAAQIARLSAEGVRVVGVAGGERKCRWLTEELGLDGAIDYKGEDVGRAIDRHLPDGVDLFFDNVGGRTLQLALLRMRRHGRVVCCGAVSTYNDTVAKRGPAGVPALLTIRSLTMQGFVVTDYYAPAVRAAAEAQLAEWIDAGALVARDDVVAGLEHAPDALRGLFRGDNIGKRMVRVAT
ncbi:MAG: NADP-dependent oxidoreductase [Proteobacteria bacterium]|nr:MAG: NADP-dependent oxidoreductase [Pseudomonadota bacterium]